MLTPGDSAEDLLPAWRIGLAPIRISLPSMEFRETATTFNYSIDMTFPLNPKMTLPVIMLTRKYVREPTISLEIHTDPPLSNNNFAMNSLSLPGRGDLVQRNWEVSDDSFFDAQFSHPLEFPLALEKTPSPPKFHNRQNQLLQEWVSLFYINLCVSRSFFALSDIEKISIKKLKKNTFSQKYVRREFQPWL